MNKRYEKFINKKSQNNAKIKTSKLPKKVGLSFTYKGSKLSDKALTISNKYINMYRNKKNKNTYTGFSHKKGKFKLQQGMFSYKRSTNSNLSNSVESNISNERNNLSMISNKVNSMNSINKNNTLFPNLKLYFDNGDISSIKAITNNDNNISNQFHNHSAMYLNKYKIMNSIIHKQNKSMDFVNIENNTFNNTNYNYDFSKYNNIIINNINPPNTKLNPDEIHIKPKKEIKVITNNLKQFLNKSKKEIIKQKENNVNGLIINNFFISKSKAEKESRRMIIEYLKVLKQSEKNKSKLINILRNQNISDKVMNQKKILNTNLNIYTMSSKNSKFFYPKNSKKIESPRETTNLRNVSKFLKDMNDITKDKISMVKYLSIPRVMKLIFNEKIYKFIFILKPNQFSYLKGLESYIFQWIDIKTKKEQGGFDLIKVNSCCLNYKENKNVLIETFDGEIHREYEFITNSNKDATIFVKSINYLSRLEKCKIYNKKYYNID